MIPFTFPDLEDWRPLSEPIGSVSASAKAFDRDVRGMIASLALSTSADALLRERARQMSLRALTAATPEERQAAQQERDEMAEAYMARREWEAEVGAAYIAFREAERVTCLAAQKHGAPSAELDAAEVAYDKAKQEWERVMVTVEGR